MRILAGIFLIASLIEPEAMGQTKWRTPWGDPDLQGSWSNATTTPLQRPAAHAGKERLSEQEIAAGHDQGGDNCAVAGNRKRHGGLLWFAIIAKLRRNNTSARTTPCQFGTS